MQGFPGGASGKERDCQSRRRKRGGFDPWVGKISRRRAWQPRPPFWLGESPWTEEAGGLQFIGLQRVEHNCSDLALCKKKSSMKLDTYISTRGLVR